MLVFPSERRILRATRLAASLLARTAQLAKTWQRFLGHLSSLRELVPMAVDHMLLIQLMLHDQWTARTYASTRTRRSRRVRVVDVTGQSSSWPPLPASRSDYVDRNRCHQGRVGRPPRRQGGLRALVSEPGLSGTSIGSS